MSTTMLSTTHRQNRRVARTRYEGIHIGRLGLGSVAVLAVLISAWGAIVPYVGPVFGYDVGGSHSWHWTLAHSLVALIPGAVGVAIGVLMLAETRGVAVGRGRLSLAMVGFIAVLAGAWFVVGPLALPVLISHGTYFAGATPLRQLANEGGASMGPGLLLALCGAFALGWASRHQERASQVVDGAAASQDVTAPASS
jgi:hypothetical protein